MVNIGEYSCALFASHPDSNYIFLGTAFFFRRGSRVLAATAAHCIPNFEIPHVLLMSGAKGNHKVTVAAIDKAADACLLLPASEPQDVSVSLSDEVTVQGNITLQTYEYSATELVGNTWNINPATRMGNCVRQLKEPAFLGLGAEHVLELSFPALRGASGAPVIELKGNDLLVRGVIVANAERHLLPAHIETVLTDDNALLEERKYFLPQAAAVSSVHFAKLADNWLLSQSTVERRAT